MKPRIDVFISSTAIDLPDHRAAVRDAILSLGFYPSGMETWPASDQSPVDKCQRMMADAEIFIGVYAHRYGWCPPGYDGKGITELEYDWAKRKGIPRLCFVMDKSHPWRTDLIEYEAKSKLDAFKAIVQERVVGFFTTPDNLAKQVSAALAQWREANQLNEPKIPWNFVPRPDRFVGREDELKVLDQLLSEMNVVAITAVKGIGGIGKSSLVKAFAQQDERFKLKLWAELGQIADESTLPRILRTWTGQDFPPDWSLDQTVAEARKLLTTRAHERSSSVLLVVDDVWMETVTQARKLREAAPINTKMLITTRSEDVAAALDASSTTLDILPPDQGAALVIDLVGIKANDLQSDLEALSTTLGGHPLALTLAARQLRRDFQPTSARRLIEKLKRGIDTSEDFKDLKLDTGDSKLDSVSTTLRLTLDAFGKGDDVLRERRQSQFRALGALPLDLPFRAVHAMFACNPEDEDEGYEMLADFTAEGMITSVPDRDDWYIQHRLLHAYAFALLKQHNEVDQVEERHCNYLSQLAYDCFSQPPETWKATEDDLPQIHALGDTLTARLAGTDNLEEQDRRLQIMSRQPLSAEEAQGKSDLLRHCINFDAAVYNYISGRYLGKNGRRWLWAGLTAARTLNMLEAIRLFTQSLGTWYRQRNEMQTALDYFEQALAVSRAQGDRPNEAVTLNNIAATWSDLRKDRKALTFYRKAHRIFHEVGDKGHEVAALNNVGVAFSNLGETKRALAIFQQTLPVLRELQNKVGEATTLSNIAMAWNKLGDSQKALTLLEQTLPLLQEVGEVYFESAHRSNMAVILWDLGRQTEAFDQLQLARDLKARVDLNTEAEDYALNQWRILAARYRRAP